MTKILILTIRPLHNGPRIIREINALNSNCEIVTVGLTKPQIDGVGFHDITKVRYSIIDRFIRKLYRYIFRGQIPKFDLPIMRRYVGKMIKYENPAVVIVHDPEFLPQLSGLKRTYGFKLVYNAHEYHPLQFDSIDYWLKTAGKYYYWIYKEFLDNVDLMINVCEGIANKCKQEFGKDSIVIPNACTYYEHIEPVINTKNDRIHIIHHGNAIRARKIEYMIEAVKKLGERFSLDLILVPRDANYIAELRAKAKSAKNINFLEPVRFDEIVPLLNNYDVGLFNLPPYTFNYKYALPNKIFEFIQARLCLVISNSTEMKKVVEEHKLGLVSNGHSVEDLVDCLDQLDKVKIEEYKKNADNAAKSLSAENYYTLYQNEIYALLKK